MGNGASPFSDFITLAQIVGNIKKQETILPIARRTAVVGPLLVGDDLAIRSSISSPAQYDRELTKLIHTHTELVNDETSATSKPNYETFIAQISNIDKISLIWAIYKTTYETLGPRPIKCQQDSCGAEFKEEISLEALIQEDTFEMWEDPIPFHEYVHRIEVKYGDYMYSFESRLPSIRDNNRILGMLSNQTIQRNLDALGAVYSRPDQLTLLTKTIEIKKISEAEGSKTSSPQEISLAFNKYIPQVVAEEFFKKYGERFDKYIPKFYKMCKCPECQTDVKFQTDLELEFFRRSLLGRGESV